MKRSILIVAVILMLASSAASAPGGAAPARPGKSGKIPAPEALRSVAIDKVERGMRVKLELTYARPMIGTVNLVTDTLIGIDLTTEPDGLPGKMRFRKSDIMLVWELKPQTDDEKREVVARRSETVAKMKIEVSERVEKMKSEDAAEETRAKTEAEGIRKAMDVVVRKEDEEKMRALLAEYPPEEWGEATFREVRENWILRDLQPTPKQSRFLIIFDEWKAARDTVAVLDVKEKQKAGEQLLMKFPPSEGWGKGRLDAIDAKEAAGTPLAENEAEFKKSWKDWSAAAVRRAVEVTTPPAPTPEETGETPAEPAPTEKPAEPAPAPAPVEKPAEPAPAPVEKVPAEKAPETPADAKPAPAPAP